MKEYQLDDADRKFMKAKGKGMDSADHKKEARKDTYQWVMILALTIQIIALMMQLGGLGLMLLLLLRLQQ